MASESTITERTSDSLAVTARPCQSLPGLELVSSYETIAPVGFELYEEIGRGGMGVVYRAHDLSFDREVALKVLLPKYLHDTTNASRFLEEARITGQLQHPGIPAVHQTGKLADGCPYLVMKLIKGFTLSDLIWKRKPGSRDHDLSQPHTLLPNYLSIFEAICQAMGYAHAHHVIHRDLKPHNIMVGAYGEVQVMDWGLAKVLAPERVDLNDTTQLSNELTQLMGKTDSLSTHASGLTTAGCVLGTPAYMAPEQAMGDNAEVGPRADVFGLGALLCCMLTGKPPIMGETPDAERMLSALGLLQETYDRLDACGAEPDLIALAKRCLAVDPRQRPADGQAVAREVAQLRVATEARARLAEAERTKALVHAEELQHRRRLLWVVIAVLLMGMAGTTWGLIHASAKEKEAREKADETSTVLNFMSDEILASIRPSNLEKGLGRNVTMREVLENARLSLATKFKDKPLVEARIRMSIGRSFEFLGDYDIALEDLQRALDLRRSVLGNEHQDTLMALLGVANVQELLEHAQQAMEARLEAYQISKKLYGLKEHITQMSMNNLANCYEKLGKLHDAAKLREDVLALTRKYRGETDPFTMLSMNNLGAAYTFIGKQEQALVLLDEALALQTKYLAPNHSHTLETMCTKAECLVEMKRAKEAVRLYEHVLYHRKEISGPDHPDTLTTMLDFAVCLTQLGRHKEALQFALDARPLCERRLGPAHTKTMLCLSMIIGRLCDLKRGDEAMDPIQDFYTRCNDKNAKPALIASVYAQHCDQLLTRRKHTEAAQVMYSWYQRNWPDAELQVQQARSWAKLARLQLDMKKDSQQSMKTAVNLLEQATKSGWNKPEILQHNDFTVLQQMNAFEQLSQKK